MKKNIPLEMRKKELIATGLCNTFDFIPETKTSIENYTFDFQSDTEAKSLLKLAHKQLSLVDSQLERLERITKAILKLENKTVAEPCHIAEAVQYVMIETEV